MAEPSILIPGSIRRFRSVEGRERDPAHQAHLTLYLLETLVDRVIQARDLLSLILTESVREILTGRLDNWSKKYGARVKELAETYYDVDTTRPDCFRLGLYGHLDGAGLKGIDSPEALTRLYEEALEMDDSLGVTEVLIHHVFRVQQKRRLNPSPNAGETPEPSDETGGAESRTPGRLEAVPQKIRRTSANPSADCT
jgi:hypothetical protein